MGMMTSNNSLEQTVCDAEESVNCKIAIAMHKPYRTPKDTIYLPVHVGAALHPDILPNIAQDNSGDNISSLNPYYSELTALYWIWKNSDADYKGLVHYRRHFSTNNIMDRLFKKERINKVATEQDIRGMLADVDIILPKERNYFIETIYSHYIHTHSKNQLVITREIIKSEYPEYIQAFDQVMRKRKAHMFNMLIMSNDKLDEYCSWVFPILSKLTERIDPAQYDSFSARYPGRISELLLDVWLITKGYRYKELSLINIEPVNWVKKGSSFILAKFAHKQYSASF